MVCSTTVLEHFISDQLLKKPKVVHYEFISCAHPNLVRNGWTSFTVGVNCTIEISTHNVTTSVVMLVIQIPIKLILVHIVIFRQNNFWYTSIVQQECTLVVSWLFLWLPGNPR